MVHNIDLNKEPLIAEQVLLRTQNETQRALRCSRTFLWKERKAGKIKAIKAGKKVLFLQSAIDAYLKINQEEVSHV